MSSAPTPAHSFSSHKQTWLWESVSNKRHPSLFSFCSEAHRVATALLCTTSAVESTPSFQEALQHCRHPCWRRTHCFVIVCIFPPTRHLRCLVPCVVTSRCGHRRGRLLRFAEWWRRWDCRGMSTRCTPCALGAPPSCRRGGSVDVVQREGRWKSDAYKSYVRSHGVDTLQQGKRTVWDTNP